MFRCKEGRRGEDGGRAECCGSRHDHNDSLHKAGFCLASFFSLSRQLMVIIISCHFYTFDDQQLDGMALMRSSAVITH